MKITPPFRIVGACAVASVLAFCGCSRRSQFEPMVVKDAEFALGVNLDKQQAFKVVDAYADLVFDLLKLNDQSIQKAKEKIAAYKEELFRDAPEGVRGFLDESGLRDAELRWAVLSSDNIKFEDGMPRLDGLALAVAGKVDGARLISAIQKRSAEVADHAVVFTETTIGGEKAWHVEPKGSQVARKMKDMFVDPYVASLDGQLLLVAMSRSLLEKQILLYRKRRRKGDALRGFSAADGELMRLHVSGIGDLVRKNMSRHELDTTDIPHDIILGLKDLDISVKVSPDGKLSDTLRLEAASEKDADNLRALVKTELMFAMSRIDREKMQQSVKKAFEDVTVGGKDAQVEILQGHGVLLSALCTNVWFGLRDARPPLKFLAPFGVTETSGCNAAKSTPFDIPHDHKLPEQDRAGLDVPQQPPLKREPNAKEKEKQ